LAGRGGRPARDRRADDQPADPGRGGRYSPTLPGIVKSETVVVKQCDGAGHNCIVVSATHTPPTSKKVAAFGHAYTTCASVTFIDGRNFVNRCSPFIAYP